MPVKWTPDTDQVLLLKILETSDISPKCAEISSKWPPSLDRPTPRAISERIFKIRSAAKASGTAGHFSISAPTTKSNSVGTPRKNAAAVKKPLPKKTTGGGGNAESSKRKRGARGEKSDEEASDDDDDVEADTFNSDDDNNNNGIEASDDEEEEAPAAKKTKINNHNNSAANSKGKNKKKTKGLVKLENEEEENKTIHDKGYENAFGGGDDGTNVDDVA